MPFTGMVGAPGFGNCVTIAALCDMMEKNSRRRWVRILFICHGNICRSPMAEYIMKELVKREGVAGDWEIESAAVSVRRSAIRCIMAPGEGWRGKA